jgi:FlaA1/EpsC-like NDP-sugar epimerase
MEIFILDEYNWKEHEVLILGGTGSLGKTILKKLLTEYHPKGIRIFSRDEYKQWLLKQQLKSWGLKGNVSFLIGDVRDYKRLNLAMKNVDVVYNTAAMKQVPACENNPFEAVKTNITGAETVIRAAIENKVKRVIHVSTDKACYPVNLYGATKAVAEKLFIHANLYSAFRKPKFSCVRYGNVLGSRGSVIPLFKEQAKTGVVTITDPNMTRFWITLNEVTDFIIKNTFEGMGGDIFVPKMKSLDMLSLAKIIAPNCEYQIIGDRFAEKTHECLITKEEYSFFDGEKYIVKTYTDYNKSIQKDLKFVNKIFTSKNAERLTKEEFVEKINGLI